jgi:hypothetical protein
MSKVKTTWPGKVDKERFIKRDKVCIYCSKQMRNGKDAPRADWATVEHLNHRSDWDSVGNYIKEGKDVTEIVGMCCWSCNASRGALPLPEWFEKQYCIDRNINLKTVAPVVRQFLSKFS